MRTYFYSSAFRRKGKLCRSVVYSYSESANSKIFLARVRCGALWCAVNSSCSERTVTRIAGPTPQLPGLRGRLPPTAPLAPVGNRLYWRHMHGAASCVLQATSLCCLIRLGHMEKKRGKQRNSVSVLCLCKEQSLVAHRSCMRFASWMSGKVPTPAHVELSLTSIAFPLAFWKLSSTVKKNCYGFYI
jgi:hypothetical protein